MALRNVFACSRQGYLLCRSSYTEKYLACWQWTPELVHQQMSQQFRPPEGYHQPTVGPPKWAAGGSAYAGVDGLREWRINSGARKSLNLRH